MIRAVAGGLMVAAIAGGVASGILVSGGSPAAPDRSKPRAHAHRYRDGPVHGLMLLPLADPDGRHPTAYADR